MSRLFLEKGWVLLLVGKKPTFIKGEVEGGMWKVEDGSSRRQLNIRSGGR